MCNYFAILGETIGETLKIIKTIDNNINHYTEYTYLICYAINGKFKNTIINTVGKILDELDLNEIRNDLVKKDTYDFAIVSVSELDRNDVARF